MGHCITQGSTQQGVPRVFHSTVLLQAPQSKDIHVIQSLESQTKTFAIWEKMQWTEKDFTSIIQQKPWRVPHAEKLLEIGAWAIISDFLRLYAMYMYGGIYADWDVEFIGDKKPWIETGKLILGFEPYTKNGRGTGQIGAQVMISPKKHLFWQEVYTQYANTLWKENFSILPSTLTDVLEQQYSLPRIRDNTLYYHLKSDIRIVPYYVFYPFMGTRNFNQKEILPQTLCLHWEHSQQKNAQAPGWTQYLKMLQKLPK